MLAHIIIFFGLSSSLDLLCSASNATETHHPAFVVRLNANGLAMLSELASMYIMSDYANGRMPNVSDSGKCLADVCSLYNIAIESYTPPKSTMDTMPGMGVEFFLTGAGLELVSEFTVETGDETFNGHVRTSVVGISLEAMVTLKKGLDGRLEVSLNYCSIDIETMYNHVIDATNENFSDSLRSDFYEAIGEYFEKSVYESILMMMCNKTQIITEIIQNQPTWMNEKLRRHELTMNSRLVRNPIIEIDCIELAFSGEICLLNDTQCVSSQPPMLELPAASESSMLAVYMNPSIVNTCLDALFTGNQLSLNVTKDSLPSKYGYLATLFNTTCDDDDFCLGTVLPNATQMHPNASATLVIQASIKPSINMSNGSARLNAAFDLSIVIPEANGSETVAKLSVFVSMSCALFLSDTRLESRFYDPKVSVTDKETPKEFALLLSRFPYVLQFIVDFFIIPQMNYYGAVGIQLENLFGLGVGLRHSVHHELPSSIDAFVFYADIVHDTMSG